MFILNIEVPKFNSTLISRAARLANSLREGSVPDIVFCGDNHVFSLVEKASIPPGAVDFIKGGFGVAKECLLSIRPNENGVKVDQHLGDVWRASVGFDGKITSAEKFLWHRKLSPANPKDVHMLGEFVRSTEERLRWFIGDPDFNPELVKSVINNLRAKGSLDKVVDSVTLRGKTYNVISSESVFGITKILGFELDVENNKEEQDTFSSIWIRVYDGENIHISCDLPKKEGELYGLCLVTQITKYGRLVRSFLFDDTRKETETFDNPNYRAFIDEVLEVVNRVLVNKSKPQMVA